ncbi:MAG: M61 family metallopeptidase [Lentimicrobiaceae bacterium]|nr:M61 family metallopeptidase [Lentimicrobiaceae bacterium]
MLITFTGCNGPSPSPSLYYMVSMPEPSSHIFHVELLCEGLKKDTVFFRMPRWTPGYYQIMEYAKNVRDFSAEGLHGGEVFFDQVNSNTWRVVTEKKTSFKIRYDVYADKKFVAENFLDATHGYIVPAATFMYIDGLTGIPVHLKIKPYDAWQNIATGLERTEGTTNEFTAPDFDVLYDCPLLIGSLDELPSFTIDGIEHRFIAYDPGSFDRKAFRENLKKVVKAAADIMGDIPYTQYTFIGIGPGFGGIEHLNSTTVSFSGRGLDAPDTRQRMMKFLAHEYFHNYNVKRIRPFELGPFDYDTENRTNLLWMSEGVTVYYEYLIVRRAGLMSEEDLLTSLAGNIDSYENDPGRFSQSLSQASYITWSDGPFGQGSGGPDRSISCYDKGPLAGMILDLAIRHATGNEKSLDDVMRLLYRQYYLEFHRGFTDAEFQQACEQTAGISLNKEFEYVYTTREIEYSQYLSYAGLKLTEEAGTGTGGRKFRINRIDNPDPFQLSVYQSWVGR